MKKKGVEINSLLLRLSFAVLIFLTLISQTISNSENFSNTTNVSRVVLNFSNTVNLLNGSNISSNILSNISSNNLSGNVSGSDISRLYRNGSYYNNSGNSSSGNLSNPAAVSNDTINSTQSNLQNLSSPYVNLTSLSANVSANPANASQNNVSSDYKIISKNSVQVSATVGEIVKVTRTFLVDNFSDDKKSRMFDQEIPREAKNLKIHENKHGNLTNLSVSFELPPAKKTENYEKDGKLVKIYSEIKGMHYYNISSTTSISPTRKDLIRLYWMKNGIRKDVTKSPDVHLVYIDSNNDGLIDKLSWTVPRLSDQFFEIKLNEVPLSTQSEFSGSIWQLIFTYDNSGVLYIRNLNPNILKYLKIYSYDNNVWMEKDMVSTPKLSNNYTLSTYWNSTQNKKGMIQFNVTSPDLFYLNFTMNGATETVSGSYYYEQIKKVLNIDNPIVNFRLCSFDDSHWMCNPGQNDAGYDGKDVRIMGTSKNVTLKFPRNSTVTQAKITVSSNYNKSTVSYPLRSSFYESSVTTGDFEQNNQFDDIAVAGQNNIDLFANGTKIRNLSTGLITINDIASSNVDPSTITDEFIIAGIDGLYALHQDGSIYDWILHPDGFRKIFTSRIYNSSQEYSFPENVILSLSKISSTNLVKIKIPDFGISVANKICYVGAKANKFGTPASLDVSIDGSLIGKIKSINSIRIREYSSTGNLSTDSINLSEYNSVKFIPAGISLPSPMSAESCYIKTPVAKKGNLTGKNLIIEFAGKNYTISGSGISTIVSDVYTRDHDSSVETYDDMISVDRVFSRSSPFTYTPGNICYVNTPLNYVGNNTYGSQLGLGLIVNGKSHLIDTSKIKYDNIQSYHVFTTGSNYSCVGCLGKTLNVSLSRFGVSSSGINGESCQINAAFNRFNSTGNLTLQIGTKIYDVDESKITKTNVNSFSLTVQNKPIYYSKYTRLSSGDEITFDLFGITPSGGVKAKVCYIKTSLCKVGTGLGLIKASISGTSKVYSVDTSQVSSNCGTNTSYNTVYTKADCSELLPTRSIHFYCVAGSGCNSTSYVRLMMQNGTSSSNSYYFASNGTSYSNVNYDYMVSVYTNTSLDYNVVPVNVNCTYLNSSASLKFSCTNCGNDGYNLIKDQYNNASVELYTNKSLKYNYVSTTVPCSDLYASNIITYYCDNCTTANHYRILKDKTSNDYAVDILSRSSAHDNVYSKVPCSDIKPSNEILYRCPNCTSGGSYFLFQNNNSAGYSYYFVNSSSSWKQIMTSDFQTSIYTNTSFDNDEFFLKTDCSKISPGKNITFSCTGCNASNYYNLLNMNSTHSSSSYSINSGANYNSLANDVFFEIITLSNTSKTTNVLALDNYGSAVLYDSNLNEKWSFQPNNIMTASIGEYNINIPGNEIVIGTNSKAYLLENNKTIIWQIDANTKSSAIAQVDGENKILLGLNNGSLLDCTISSCRVVYSSADSINSIAVGDFIDTNAGDEIALLLDASTIKILNSDFVPIETVESKSSIVNNIFPTKSSFYSINQNKSSLGVFGANGVESFDIEYPSDLKVYAGGQLAYSGSGIFKSEVISSNLASKINQKLATCNSNFCKVNLTFADSTGYSSVNLKNVNITFNYNITDKIKLRNNVYKLSTIRNVTPGQQVRNKALEINVSPTLIPVYVRALVRNNPTSANFIDPNIGENFYFDNGLCLSGSGAGDTSDNQYASTSTAYLGYTLSDGTTYGCSKNFYIDTFAKKSHYMWFDETALAYPVKKVVSELKTLLNYSVNMNILRNESLTSDEIYDVVSYFTFNDSIVKGNFKLYADLYNNGSRYDITPSTTVSNCNTNSPTYETKVADGYNFKVCSKDTNSQNGADYIKIVQPLLGPSGQTFENVKYVLFTSINSKPVINSIILSSGSIYWGDKLNYTVNVSDNDHDNVTLKLFGKFGATWSKLAQSWIVAPGIKKFMFTTDKTWINYFGYRLEYYDVNSTYGKINPALNTTTDYVPEILKHNINVINVTKNNTKINVLNNTENHVVVRLTDTTKANTAVTTDASCQIFIDSASVAFSQVNSTGYCNFNLCWKSLLH